MLERWVYQKLGTSSLQLYPLAGDASFRRYFRVEGGDRPYIAVDAAPEHDLGNSAFVALSRLFMAQGLCVPQVYHYEADQGFLLVDDLGDGLFTQVLAADNADQLYGAALKELEKLQRCQIAEPATFARFERDFLDQELRWTQQWYFERHLQLSFSAVEKKLVAHCFQLLKDVIAAQPEVLTHRDYHARNLLWLPDAERVALLDFQDALWGPITYDAVSLLRDCYISWPQERVLGWTRQFQLQLMDSAQLPKVSSDQFMRWFDLTGMQRHLKAIFIFARKYWRDGEPRYLPDMHRGLHYIHQVCQQHTELQSFQHWFEDCVLPSHAAIEAKLL